MKSKIDEQPYILEIKFDNYKEMPLYLEFIDPTTGIPGTKNAYPKNQDSFFHPQLCICHPCSRKSYGGYANVHQDWSLSAWQQNPKATTLTRLKAILHAIYFRINDETLYEGRMK